MNCESHVSIGCISAPMPKHGHAPPPSMSTFAINRFGDVALLDAAGRIKFTALRGDPDHAIHELAIDDAALVAACGFTNIEFNDDGTILLLWSDENAGILEIPRTLAPDGAIDVSAKGQCIFSLIGQDYLSSSNNITKASFHPMSNVHVVILMKGSLLLIDITYPNNNETQYYPLGINNHFISYCFGPSIDWMKFTIFLLSNKKSDKAEVFCLCPVIPKGISVPKNSVRDLWAWIDEQIIFQNNNDDDDNEDRGRNDNNNDENEGYLKSVRQYVTAAFGPRKELEKEENIAGRGEMKSNKSYVTAGEYYTVNNNSLYIEMEELLYSAPNLQGPFYTKKDNNMNNKSKNYNKIEEQQNQKNVPTDICVPKIREESGAPVLVISYDNGDVDFFIIGNEGNGPCGEDVSPSWLTDNTSYNNNNSHNLQIEKNNFLSYSSNSYKYENENKNENNNFNRLQKKNKKILAPGLILVEKVPVNRAVASLTNSSENHNNDNNNLNHSTNKWMLTPDPVISHCFHVTNRMKGSTYLLSCSWLLRTLSQPIDNNYNYNFNYNSGNIEDESRTRLRNGTNDNDYSGSSEEMKQTYSSFPSSSSHSNRPSSSSTSFSTSFSPSSSNQYIYDNSNAQLLSQSSTPSPQQFPSTVIPVFVPADDFATSKPYLLSGFAIGFDRFDCFLRHSCFIRLSTGSFTAVDLTLHMKMCSQQRQSQRAIQDLKYSQSESRALIPSLESSAWQKVTKNLLLQAMEGLKNIPQPSVEKSGISQTSLQCSKNLLLASEHTESQIATPLQELSRRIRYRIDVLKDTYAAQLELLEGSYISPSDSRISSGSGSGSVSLGNHESNSFSSSDDVFDQSGLKLKINELEDEQKILLLRVQNIQERSVIQQQRLSQVYSAALSTKTKLSQSEREHRDKLIEWCNVAKHMDIGVDSLRRKVREHVRMQNLIQNQVPVPGRGPQLNKALSGSARKAFASPLGRMGGHPMTPDGDKGKETVPFTPTSDKKNSQGQGEGQGGVGSQSRSGVNMSYRSPGFRSGPAYTYKADSGAGTRSSPGPASLSSGVGSSTTNRAPRRSAYMTQASPLGKTLNSNLSSTDSKSISRGINDPRSSLPFNSVNRNSFSGFSSPVGGFSSPLPNRFLNERDETGHTSNSIIRNGNIDSNVNNNELSQSDIASYELQLNAQQNVLEMAEASVKALEERVRNLKQLRGL